MAIVDSLIVQLKNFWDNDPIISSMNNSSTLWGDILMNHDYTSDITFKFSDDILSQSSSLLDESNDADMVSAETASLGSTHTICDDWEQVPTKKSYPTVRTLIVKNLPREMPFHDLLKNLRSIFSKYGPVADVYIPKNMDKTSPYFGTLKGFALIKFINNSHTVSAFISLSTKPYNLNDKQLFVEFAKSDKE
jgi:hypothetical protein